MRAISVAYTTRGRQFISFARYVLCGRCRIIVLTEGSSVGKVMLAVISSCFVFCFFCCGVFGLHGGDRHGMFCRVSHWVMTLYVRNLFFFLYCFSVDCFSYDFRLFL